MLFLKVHLSAQFAASDPLCGPQCSGSVISPSWQKLFICPQLHVVLFAPKRKSAFWRDAERCSLRDIFVGSRHPFNRINRKSRRALQKPRRFDAVWCDGSRVIRKLTQNGCLRCGELATDAHYALSAFQILISMSWNWSNFLYKIISICTYELINANNCLNKVIKVVQILCKKNESYFIFSIILKWEEILFLNGSAHASHAFNSLSALCKIISRGRRCIFIFSRFRKYIYLRREVSTLLPRNLCRIVPHTHTYT